MSAPPHLNGDQEAEVASCLVSLVRASVNNATRSLFREFDSLVGSNPQAESMGVSCRFSIPRLRQTHCGVINPSTDGMTH